MTQRKRRYCLTLNNPTDPEIRFLMDCSKTNVTRMIFAHEVGKEGTPHLQGFVHLKNAMTLSALKKWLQSKRYHIEAARGTDYEAWTYCQKDDRVLLAHGDEPSIEGDLSDWEKIAQMVRNGCPNSTIIGKYPGIAIRCQAALDRMRLDHERETATWRDLEVVFITGPTGCGKTRGVMDGHGYSNVYRSTDKKHPFETYSGQEVIIFEEFRGGIKIEEMLNYLDGYPVELPARYANKMAQYTTVYMLSNIEFDELYPRIQERHPETWNAFKRRVTEVRSQWSDCHQATL